MDFLLGGIGCIVLLLVLMALGLQIGLAFILAGFLVGGLLIGFDSVSSLLGQTAYYSVATPTWTAIPLFILMGAFASDGGLAKRAYDGIYVLSRNVRGSLLIATSVSCGVFGAVSGSSIATTAIFTRVALPEMLSRGYDRKLSIGCIASAGTFASMIPPSMMMVIYGLFTQQSIGKLFAAGLVPGIITVIAYAVLINVMVRRNPALAPLGTEDTPEEGAPPAPSALTRFLRIWPVALISVVVMGGIYAGFFTPTEAAAVGAVSALAVGWYLKTFRRGKDVVTPMRDAANITGMLFLINIGALFYSRILAITDLPTEMTMALSVLNVPPFVVLMIVILLLFFLGMIMVPVGIYALTLPILVPLLVNLGYDPIWFGVIALKMIEIGAITPPVGLNVFAARGALPRNSGISTDDIFRGCVPFLLCEFVVLAILIAFPQFSLWLPNLLFG